MYDDVPSVFINTGLEYPEIQKFAMSQKNVIMIRPEMRFDEVLKTYGYPVISKEISQKVHDANVARRKGNENSYALRQFNGTYVDTNGKRSMFNCEKWAFLLDAEFDISHKCCDVMKKRPAHKYSKETGRMPIIGTMADESMLRRQTWMKYGCNSFDGSNPSSKPMSFWTEQDVLRYIKEYEIPYCSIYGDIIEENGRLKTTGKNRTGCVFCGFGAHVEKEPNRFQKLKKSHPNQYRYCIGGGKHVDGRWQPNKEGLGLGRVLDYIKVPYN